MLSVRSSPEQIHEMGLQNFCTYAHMAVHAHLSRMLPDLKPFFGS